MLISFSVKNFGCIKDEVTLSFEADKSTDLEDYYIIEPIPGLRLLKLGLIFGPNASGKTTVLKALDFLRGLILEDADSDFSPFLFSEEKESTFFSINFLVHGIRYKYELEINEDEILEEKLFRFNDKKSIVYTRSTDLEKDISHIQFGRKSNIDTANKKTIKDNTLTSQTVMGALNSLNVDASELKGIIKWFKNNLHEIIHPRTNLTDFIGEKIIDELIDKNQIINYLNKADFSINDIIIKETDKKDSNFFGSLFKGVVEGLSGETRYNKKTIGDYMDSRFDEIFFVHKNIVGANTLISYDEESQGTQRYFQFSGLLDLLIRNSVILSIDELESSLHPDLLE
ncbi:MAG: AAA family ATPase, partial [Saprospiraceae bacterium]